MRKIISRKVFFGGANGQDAAMRILVTATLLLLGCSLVQSENIPLPKLGRTEQAERIAGDLKSVVIYRLGLSNVVTFSRQQTNLFPVAISADPRLPRREEKEVLWPAWKP